MLLTSLLLSLYFLKKSHFRHKNDLSLLVQVLNHPLFYLFEDLIIFDKKKIGINPIKTIAIAGEAA